MNPEEPRVENTGLDDAENELLLAAIARGKGLPELQGDTEDAFVSTLRNLKAELGIPDDAAVVYPGSATHVGVARVFGKEHVTHVDPDERAVGVLRAAGYQAVAAPIEELAPDARYDALVALNSYGAPTTEVLDSLLKPGAVIITNNYTHWASRLAEIPSVRLLGAVMPAYNADTAQYLPADALPEDATEVRTAYVRIETEPSGVVRPVMSATPTEGALEHSFPAYPDALFAFRYDHSL